MLIEYTIACHVGVYEDDNLLVFVMDYTDSSTELPIYNLVPRENKFKGRPLSLHASGPDEGDLYFSPRI